MVKAHLVVAASVVFALSAAVVSVEIARRASREPGQSALASEGADGERRAPPRPTEGKVRPGPPSMLHLDERHTNRSPFAGPRSPRVAWSFDTGGPIEAAPIVLPDGTIVVTSLGGKLYGLQETGTLRYTVDLGERAYGSPLALDGAIFVGSDAHKLFGLGFDGGIRFRLETGSDVDTGVAPTPWGGLVFASGNNLYAATPDGTILWRVRARKKCYSSPAVGEDGAVYFGSQDHHLYAVSPEGKVKWRTDLGADVDSSPAIEDDGTIIAGTDRGEIAALEPEAGAIRWRAHVGGYVRGSLSLGRDGTIFTGTYGPHPNLVALEPSEGKLRFRFSIAGTGSSEFGIHGGPVEDADGRLYFGAQDDHAYCLDAAGGLLWKWKTGGDVDAPLVITPSGLLLVGSDDGKLYALESP